MGEIIEREGGFIDKFVGDAIVAVFGAPIGPPDHAAAAVRAARAMVISSACGPFVTRPGMNSGPVLIGILGASRRFNYTVIGDTVENLASRLEGANKEYGTTILVSGDTRAAAPKFVFREVDQVRVVGHAQPINIFAPLPEGTDMSREAGYEVALALYRKGHSRSPPKLSPCLRRIPLPSPWQNERAHSPPHRRLRGTDGQYS